jgi:hypothetical protein
MAKVIELLPQILAFLGAACFLVSTALSIARAL